MKNIKQKIFKGSTSLEVLQIRTLLQNIYNVKECVVSVSGVSLNTTHIFFQLICREMGGSLVEIETASENNVLGVAINSTGSMYQYLSVTSLLVYKYVTCIVISPKIRCLFVLRTNSRNLSKAILTLSCLYQYLNKYSFCVIFISIKWFRLY